MPAPALAGAQQSRRCPAADLCSCSRGQRGASCWFCPKSAVRAVPPRLLLLCLLLRSSWLTVEGGRHGAAGVPHRRGGRAPLAGSVSVGWWRSTRNSRRLVTRLPSSRVDAVVSRRQRDGPSSSAAGASGTVVGSGAPRFGCGSAVAGADPESSRCRNPLAERQRDQADERAIAVRPSRERRHCPRALLLADRKAAAPAELPAGAEIPHKAPLRLRYRILPGERSSPSSPLSDASCLSAAAVRSR